MKHLGTTPPFHGPHGGIRPNRVAEISYLRLGGLDQWVMIRGENIANPILILLHGGPGFPEMRLFRLFNATLEQHYTVVYWMQRGTSKSFDRRMPASHDRQQLPVPAALALGATGATEALLRSHGDVFRPYFESLHSLLAITMWSSATVLIPAL